MHCESKFTPGPWEIYGEEYGTCASIIGKTGWVADFINEPSPANAYLIAAAPRLYKALESFVIAMRAGVTHEEIMANIEAADREARLALADARGVFYTDEQDDDEDEDEKAKAREER